MGEKASVREGQRVRSIFFLDKSLQYHLQIRSEDHRKVEDLKDHLYGFVNKKRWEQHEDKFLRNELSLIGPDVDTYRQWLPFSYRKATRDVTDGSDWFQYSLRTEVWNVVESLVSALKRSLKQTLVLIILSLKSTGNRLSGSVLSLWDSSS